MSGAKKVTLPGGQPLAQGVVARLKVLAGMDIAEKRLPQDGWLRIKAKDGKSVDFRLSTLRTLFGEKIVLRVLDNRSGAPPLWQSLVPSEAPDAVKAIIAGLPVTL